MNTQFRPWRDTSDASERRTVSLTIDVELLSAAKAMDIDPALALEEALRTKLGLPSPANEAQESPATASSW